MPSHRYRDARARVEIPVTERIWPTKSLESAPLWVPVDLRDGNQALAEPMDPERKRILFALMVRMGYKEIEVGYPSASQTDYDFVRLIATTDIAPEDVTIVVFTPARRDLIRRTVEAIAGIRNPVVIHMYTATAPTWRSVVLGKNRSELHELILSGGRDVLAAAGDLPHIRFEFSPEVFNLTEPDYVLDVCNSMTTLWDATPDRPVIINLPATVEIATPNVYADQIEYMHHNLARRDSVILSVHPHNDRGTGIACAELAVLAGAQRVEGCIFGNGERTGNVDIATLALNLHAQGIDPMIDFSDIDEVKETVEYATRIALHPRHPYAGDLVHTAFSGTHQDAIKKGFAEHSARAITESRPENEIEWRVPYLPVDPADLGRGYEAVIRVNSQSGKGGIAYLLEQEYGIVLPRRLQVDFARRVQDHSDASGSESDAATLKQIFEASYLAHSSTVVVESVRSETGHDGPLTTVSVLVSGVKHTITNHPGGPVEALTELLSAQGIQIETVSLHQTSLAEGNSSEALSLIEYRVPPLHDRAAINGNTGRTRWAAGRDGSTLTATVQAVAQAAGAVLAESAGAH
ncbi:MAG: 2-isopropylmalate synthase [Mycetocola sp.]